MYYDRIIDTYLAEWKESTVRKPLLLRGARQVGKSSAVRHLAKGFEHFVEINFEENIGLKSVFKKDLNPERLVEHLSIIVGQPIVPQRTLLFLDEIQACPEAISSLRFFYEKMPELHVIAAGSLLEFALQSLPSYGVGRLRSLFMYPFSFDEFLSAIDERLLLEAKQQATVQAPLPDFLHARLLDHLRTFMLVGGMPEAVSRYAASKQLLESQRVLDDLYLSIKTDFAKYKNSVPQARLTALFESVVQQSGGKFVYAKASNNGNHGQLKEALDLLVMAGLVVPVTHTAANGLPLGAEANLQKQKMLLLDTGIFQRILGLDLAPFLFDDKADVINKGSIAEQFWGLEYLKYSPPYAPQALYYWHRESANANAEVDYVVQKGANIFPVEVKSSGKGRMQSLGQFLKTKNAPFGYRFSLENFSEYGDIKAFPLYAVSNFRRENSL